MEEHAVNVQVGDIAIGYSIHGAGQPAVFVHGLAEDRHHWDPVAGRLRGWQMFALDFRGHGETTLGRADATLAQLGGDLSGFLEAVTGPAPCVGFSLGGCIVMQAAALRPDLIPHCVIVGSSSIVGSRVAAFFEQRIDTALQDMPRFRVDLRQDSAGQIASAQAKLDAITARRVAAVGEGRGYVNAARAMVGMHHTPLTPLLGQIRCRADVVGGSQDAVCPRKAQDIIMAALPHGVYHEIPGVGHLMGEDNAEAYRQMLQSTLDAGRA
ncbi:MAG: alpha/beta fold hydrolase [Candidatus Lambdaproteobacteria bacterium]|nr:alpha/beta fold hydrolase [Candidatus Lambdaproteobacteria bacterium]